MMNKYHLASYLAIFSFFVISNLMAQETRPSNPNRKEIQTENNHLKSLSETKDDLCVPQYSSGCNDGDGFTDFALGEIENYGSGCDDNMGYDGWSQYLELGPAFLIPGESIDVIMRTGYNDQSASIWIDFNDDYILDQDEIVLYDFELSSAGQFYTAIIDIPSDATPGQHFLRARACWSGTCSDPCESYGYGEAEDYYVFIGEAIFGSLEGSVTELNGGAAVEGATISLEGTNSFSTSTGLDGSYVFENILVGEYTVECFKEGYNLAFDTVTIEENIISVIDFQLTKPGIVLSTLSISKTLAPNTTGEESLYIENTGNGELNWSASMLMINENTKDFMDLQFQYPAAGSYNEAGIETDGNFIYTTEWGGNGFFKYDLEGNFIEEFTIPDTYAIRDLAYDGTHFYGGSAASEVFEMDFENHELVGTFLAPTEVRAIAYNEDEDVFYANNWNTPVYIFDKTGAALGSFDVGPVGDDYYGFAYDNLTFGGPFLWGYAQIGSAENTIVQIQLPSGTETGYTLDVTTKLSGNVWGHAGGMFTHSNLVFGKSTLGGLVQGEWLWGLELGDAPTWLWVNPTSGILEGSTNEEISVLFDATDMAPGIYEAEIHFTTVPNVGNPIVEVSMTVSDDLNYPCDLETTVNCTNVNLIWDMCPAGSPMPDSFNVYRNDLVIAGTIDMLYTDSLLFPDSIYEYKITAFFGEDETFSTPAQTVNVPVPENLEPVNLTATIIGSSLILSWNIPAACLNPMGYNLYRDNTLVGFTSDTTFTDSMAGYEYFVTAVYYFGESGPSNIAVFTGNDENPVTSLIIFPNPAKDKIHIVSNEIIGSAELMNLHGKVLVREAINSKDHQMNVSTLEAGIYILKIENSNGIILNKIVIP